MCGIAGWIGSPELPSNTLRAMCERMAHRGPDSHGEAFLPHAGGGLAALGHNRLSIIDLSGGAQPMKSHDGRYTVIFNGEIYNYLELRDRLVGYGARFQTVSDTEVILEAYRKWGHDCFAEFRGMFAMAIYDSATREVVIARDVFGKKPLFYTQGSDQQGPYIVFASEISALFRNPLVERRLNVSALWNYLQWRYCPGPETFFEGILKLPPASYMIVGNNGHQIARYWTPPVAAEPRAPEPEHAAEEFLEIFDEALRIRLRADVPIGAFLSSGLDSSSIIASLVHLGASDIFTYSIGYRGDLSSENFGAAETAAMIGTKHTAMEFEYTDIISLMPKLSRHQASPLAEAATVPIYLMSMEASKDVKVIMSGEGVDEFFGGYPKHRAEAMLGGLPQPLLRVLGSAMLGVTAVSPNRMRRARIAARAFSASSFEDRMVAWFGAFNVSERRKLWAGKVPEPQMPQLPFSASNGASPLRRVMHFDQLSWLPDNLLERGDIMTMAASIEARMPFMDIRVAEFAANLPDDWRIRGGVTKRIVREALASRLPNSVLRRPKNGFRLPVAAWFRGPLREQFNDLVLGHSSICSQYLETAMVADMECEHFESRLNHEKSLWALYALEIFLREFFE
ncbi:asparagine synthase (glutamine-hydrolyzing) [Roseovarius pacificus]|uniref:asparagine synthase (glutamine-hydrolyzing) n=1 Tax=Roseovarius pacificus TaxID=337701 RepID=UPI002A188039|nr:asparagine synthase (glutamine-hydrolyzing) [Roseovarius pacificus]